MSLENLGQRWRQSPTATKGMMYLDRSLVKFTPKHLHIRGPSKKWDDTTTDTTVGSFRNTAKSEFQMLKPLGYIVGGRSFFRPAHRHECAAEAIYTLQCQPARQIRLVGLIGLVPPLELTFHFCATAFMPVVELACKWNVFHSAQVIQVFAALRILP